MWHYIFVLHKFSNVPLKYSLRPKTNRRKKIRNWIIKRFFDSFQWLSKGELLQKKVIFIIVVITKKIAQNSSK